MLILNSQFNLLGLIGRFIQMKNAVYLKKEISYISCDLPDIIERRAAELPWDLRTFKDWNKSLAEHSWKNLGLDIIKNDDENLTNCKFFSKESLSECLDYDFTIVMDDDDFLLNGIQSELSGLNENVGALIWNAAEYDFLTNSYRESHFLKDEDLPIQRKGSKVLLPGCYAIGSKVLDYIMEIGAERELVNFFSASEIIESACEYLKLEIHSTEKVYTFRPYTHFCEYYSKSRDGLRKLSSGRFISTNDDVNYHIEKLREVYTICQL